MVNIRTIMALSAAVALGGGVEIVRREDRVDRDTSPRRGMPEKPHSQSLADYNRQYFDSGKPMSKRAKRRARKLATRAPKQEPANG